MKNKDIGKAERALINAKIEITKLKKERRNTENKKIAKELKKRIEKIEDSFSHLNKNAYLEKKKKQDSIKKPSEEDIIKIEESNLKQLINEDIERRNRKNVYLTDRGTFNSDEAACQSCGAPLRDVYGVIRCKCN
ncbi:hypothetical protein [Planococcus shenhongbingii]|uniref:Uncharacterized protein n=1 Tax=Planococcus shenhongbingii TaxID=3058398 RepID=A0ABT8NGQ8_9BACL|nr:hypothetical protein [Planococcus sp. N017]MDN7247090.1 hypothetical protein [Planococcus sp. N017]